MADIGTFAFQPNQKGGDVMTPQDRRKARGELRRRAAQINTMATSDAFLKAGDEIIENEGALKEARADAKAYLQGKGVVIPDGVEVTFSEEASHCFRIRWRSVFFSYDLVTCWLL